MHKTFFMRRTTREALPSLEKFLLLFVLWSTLVLGPVLNTPLPAINDLSFLLILGCLLVFYLKGLRLPSPFDALFILTGTLVFVALSGLMVAGVDLELDALRAVARPVRAAVVAAGVFAALHITNSVLSDCSPHIKYATILKAIYLAIVLQALFIFAQFYFPGIREQSYEYLGGHEVLDYNKEFRMPGFMGAGGAQLSAVQGIGFLIGTHLLYTGLGRAWFYVIGNVLLVGSFVLTGRTGFIFIPIAVASWLTCALFDRTGARTRRGMTLASFWWLSVIVIFLALLFQWANAYMAGSDGVDWLNTALTRTFDTYLLYSETGRLEDRTTETLGDMWILPPDLPQALIGAPAFLMNAGRYPSDIGYIRLIWGYGFVGLALHVAFYLWLLHPLLKVGSVRLVGKSHAIFALWLWLSVLILNYKELFFFSRVSFPITVACMLGIGWLARVERKVTAQVLAKPASASHP